MKPLSSVKIYYYWVYWVGNQHDYIGMSAPWNPNLTGGGYVLLNVAVWGFVDVYLRQRLLTWAICGILFIAFTSLLKYTQRYYLLDDHGTPTVFLSSQRPDSIRYVQPIARERFLQLVAPELASNSSLTVKTYWIDEQRHLIGLCSPGNRDFMVVVYVFIDLLIDMIRREVYHRFFLIYSYRKYRLSRKPQLYFLLDDNGMPTKLLSTQAPASIINMRPLTREQFLQGVREGISGDVTTSGGVTRSSPTVKKYWIDGQNNYIGLSSGWNLWAMQFVGALIVLIFFGVFWLVFKNLLLAALLTALCGVIVYRAILIRGQKHALLQQYYLLDEHGIPKRFMSSLKPNSIRNVPSITREQFLQRVAAGATRILA